LTLLVIWTEGARIALREIIRYIAERSPASARSLKKEIESAPKVAALTPYLFFDPGEFPVLTKSLCIRTTSSFIA
jgi:plasmid stabilization system protein ParE